MKQYLELVRDILDNGTQKGDRTGTGTFSVFGRQLRFNLEDGFPLVTAKRTHFHSIKGELLWFLTGTRDHALNADDLREEYGVTIWDEWAGEYGTLGPIYGVQWRNWIGPREHLLQSDGYFGFDVHDQLGEVIEQIKTDPNSRRLVVSAWNVGELDDMALAPCHVTFQFYVVDGKLSCHMYQRSADVFLGVPFNIASYALLTHMVARETGLGVGDLVISFGDVHLYTNHLDQAREMLGRTPKPLSRLWLNPDVRKVDDFGMEDVRVDGYDPHPTIKAPVAV